MVVGSGIAIGQITPQAEGEIRAADVVMTVVCEVVTAQLIRSWSKEHVDLLASYVEGRPRAEIYAEQAGLVLERLRAGKKVCLVYYGHPGMLCNVPAAVIKEARMAGMSGRMLPAVSSDGCLFADLEVDPGLDGMQSYASQIFLERNKQWDPTTPLLIWQIGFVADSEHYADYPNPKLPDLVSKLVAVYGPKHQVVIYEAAQIPFMSPRKDRVCLADLVSTALTTASTLFVPPLA